MSNTKKYMSVLLEICKRIEPGKKMVQKLMYLMERKGMDLSLNYCIHFYGPYSSILDNAIHALEANDIIKINTCGLTHKISSNFTSEEDTLNASDKEILEFVLDEFANRSALELEALTTLDYIANNLLSKSATDEDIVKKAKMIKGTKFPEEYLYKELSVLREYQFLS